MAVDQKQLVYAVADRTVLSREESADITRTVLEGLAGQLSEGEARRLAADLPEPLAEQLRAMRRRRSEAHPVSVDEFIGQVSQRTGLRADDARAGTGAVLATLREALSEDDYRHVTGQLPAGYAALADSHG